MRARFLSGFIVFSQLMMFPDGGLVDEAPTSMAATVRQQMDQEFFNLERNLSKALSLAEKFRLIESAEKDLQRIRANATTRQFESDEIYMSTLVAGLEELPKSNEFSKAKCQVYQAKMLDLFEPTSESEPKSPAVKKTWDILEQLCE